MWDHFRKIRMQTKHGAERAEPIEAIPLVADTDRIGLMAGCKPLGTLFRISRTSASHAIIGHHINGPCTNSAANNHSGNSHILLDGTILTKQISTSSGRKKSRRRAIHTTRQNVEWNVSERHNELTKLLRVNTPPYSV